MSRYVQLLENRYRGRLDSDADEFIDFAVEGASRMQELIDGLRAYSTVGSTDHMAVAVDCSHVTRRALACGQTCPAAPRPVTPSSRAGSSMSGRP